MKQKIISFGGPRRRAAPTRVQAAAANGKRLKRRRTGRQTLHYLLILMVASAVFAVLSLTVFFKIESVEVTGTTKYAAEEIIETSGVKEGDNLFRVSDRSVKKVLTEKYAYVEDVKLRRTFPPKLTIQITQAQPLGAVDTAAGYVIIGRSGKVLELGAQELPETMTVVTGMYLYDPQVGRKLGEGYDPKTEKEEADKEADGFSMLISLVDAIQETEFGQITLVDFSDRLNILVIYDDRILIELGSQADLPYKLKFVKRVLENELDPSFTGTLDASLAGTSREIWTDPGDISQELEKRRHTAQKREDQEDGQYQQPAAGPSAPQSDNPDLETIPGTGPSSSEMQEQSSAPSQPDASQPPSQGQSSSMDDTSSSASAGDSSSKSPYSDDLEVIPSEPVENAG